MAIAMYGQNKDGDSLDRLASSDQAMKTVTYSALSGTVAVTHSTDTEVSFTQPAHTVIKDLILVPNGDLVTGGSSGNDLDFKVGTASLGDEICANKQINNTSDIVACAATNVNSGNLVQASGNALTFANAAVLYSADARTIHGTYTVGGNNLVEATGAIFFVQYSRLLFNFV